jgi:hypothetical protein
MLPKWPKGSDCKSDCFAFGGSNPSHATRVREEDKKPAELMSSAGFCIGGSGLPHEEAAGLSRTVDYERN